MPQAPDKKWYLEKSVEGQFLMHQVRENILRCSTKFQNVEIIDFCYSGRTLILDGEFQSTELDEFIYHEALVHPAMLAVLKPKNILIIGSGEGACLREVYKHKNIKSVTMVDIDKELVELCEKHLHQWSMGAFKDHRTTIFYKDAGEWLKKTDKKYDVIIQDLTEPFPGSPSEKLFSKNFFMLIKDRLTPQGAFALQASRIDINMDLHCDIYSTLNEVFLHTSSYNAFIPSFAGSWGFMVSSNTIDPSKISSKKINSLINKRITRSNRFYDGETHQGMFSLPLYYRNALKGYRKTSLSGGLNIKEA